MKKQYTWIVVLVAIIVIVVLAGSTDKKTDTFTIGAALPLSGPSALWGETVKNGLELALKNKTGIKVIYEDTKGMPADGVSAFNRLQDQDVDITLSALSAVSVPLSKIAAERKVPFFVTLVAASSSVIVNEYTNRCYADPAHYAGPAFTSDISPVNTAKKIAVLYRNDELGNSVKDEIKTLSTKYGKEVVFIDSFKPQETDFSTLISKIKNAKADVLIFVPATPGEGVAVVKTADRLKLGIPFVEAGAVFADADNRKQVAGIPFYSTTYEFSLATPETDSFRNEYKTAFNREAGFGAAFGYDVLNLIDRCKADADINACLRNIKSNKGIAGNAEQLLPGDFVVTMHLEKVE